MKANRLNVYKLCLVKKYNLRQRLKTASDKKRKLSAQLVKSNWPELTEQLTEEALENTEDGVKVNGFVVSIVQFAADQVIAMPGLLLPLVQKFTRSRHDPDDIKKRKS